MSSRRKLKKQINNSMELLYTDCILYQVYVVDADVEGADKVLEYMYGVHEDFINRVSVKEGNEVDGRVKTYFKKLRTDFKKELDTIGAKIAELGK